MRLISIPANPVPDNVVTGMLKTPDGVALRFARFEPPAGRRGTVCIFPGRTEWIEKYFETVRDLRNRGFAVAILDWRGQGLSDRTLGDRRKGYVGSFSEFDTDLETLMREVVLPDCPPPPVPVSRKLCTVPNNGDIEGRRRHSPHSATAPQRHSATAPPRPIAVSRKLCTAPSNGDTHGRRDRFDGSLTPERPPQP
jgi:hypothetical protein